MSDCAICSDNYPKSDQKRVRIIIDEIRKGYDLDCNTKNLKIPRKTRPGNRNLKGKVILRVLQSLCSLSTKNPFKCGGFSVREICEEIKDGRFKKLYGVEAVRLSLLYLADFPLLNKVYNGYYIERLGCQVCNELNRLAEVDPDNYRKFVRTSFSPDAEIQITL